MQSAILYTRAARCLHGSLARRRCAPKALRPPKSGHVHSPLRIAKRSLGTMIILLESHFRNTSSGESLSPSEGLHLAQIPRRKRVERQACFVRWHLRMEASIIRSVNISSNRALAALNSGAELGDLSGVKYPHSVAPATASCVKGAEERLAEHSAPRCFLPPRRLQHFLVKAGNGK